MGVIGEERAPALARRPGWSAASVAADGASADGDAELERLAADPFGAPVRVLAPRFLRDLIKPLAPLPVIEPERTLEDWP